MIGLSDEGCQGGQHDDLWVKWCSVQMTLRILKYLRAEGSGLSFLQDCNCARLGCRTGRGRPLGACCIAGHVQNRSFAKQTPKCYLTNASGGRGVRVWQFHWSRGSSRGPRQYLGNTVQVECRVTTGGAWRWRLLCSHAPICFREVRENIPYGA